MCHYFRSLKVVLLFVSLFDRLTQAKTAQNFDILLSLLNAEITSCLPSVALDICNSPILGKMCEVYVTYVANVDKGQWHAVTLVWTFKCLRRLCFFKLLCKLAKGLNLSLHYNSSCWNKFSYTNNLIHKLLISLFLWPFLLDFIATFSVVRLNIAYKIFYIVQKWFS